MKTITTTISTLTAITFLVFFSSCQKESVNPTEENQKVTEARLRFSQPTCTSILGSENDKEIILGSPETLLKALVNHGIKLSLNVPARLDSKYWQIESKCADAYVSFTSTGELFAEAHGYDNLSLENFSMKLITDAKSGNLVSISGESGKEWNIVFVDTQSYKNRIVIVVESPSNYSKVNDFALVTLNINTTFEEINGYKTARGSCSMLGFSFSG